MDRMRSWYEKHIMKRTDTIERSEGGFTLLEAILALAILAIGIMSVLQLFPLAMTEQQRAAERTAIASLARSELGRVRAGGVFSQDQLAPYMQSWLAENYYRNLEGSDALYRSWQATAEAMMSPFEDGVSLYRVTFSVAMMDGNEEKFVVYVTEL